MLNQAIQQIEGCYSLDDLQKTWVDYAEQWMRLSKDQAAKIIQLKDERKAEIETGIYRRRMDSKTLGVVDVVFDTHKPDKATVDGAEYSLPELRDLLSRKISHDDLRTVHQVKQEFAGTVIPSKQATEIESYPITRW